MEHRLKLLLAIVLTAAFASVGVARGAKHPNPQRQSLASVKTPGPAHLSDADWLQLDRRVRDIVRDEAAPGLAHAAADADHSEREADRIISFCTYAVTAWAAVATLILFGLGYYGYSQLRDAHERLASASQALDRANLALGHADATLKRIQSAETDVVQPAKQRMEQLSKSIEDALRDVQAYFDKIDDLERTTVVGEPPEFPPVKYVNQMEEADAVIMIAMRIGAVEREKLAPVFIKLGNYWDFIENHGRAIARYERALELDGHAWEAFFGLSRTFCGLAARPKTNPDAKERQLALAEDYCREAEERCPTPNVKFPLHRGWIAYERGNFMQAIEHYRAALRLDPERKRAVVSYNLSATLAKVGYDAEAIAEFAHIAARDNNWEAALTDDGFTALLLDSGPLGTRFRALLERARRDGGYGKAA